MAGAQSQPEMACNLQASLSNHINTQFDSSQLASFKV